MNQLKEIFARLSMRQRAGILVVLLIAGAGLWALMQWRKEADFKPLYTGLAPEDTAAIVQKLKETGVDYRIAENGSSVSAPSARVPELRLDMSAAGLPKTGRLGFELFDKANLGATEFVEQVNFRRALEGELERSVGALAEVEQARVHVTFTKPSVFLESREPAKASVMIKLRDGAHLAPRNVTAVQRLVGSAVEGLAPEAVSVLDMQGNLLSPIRRSPEQEETEAAMEYRQKLERDLLQKVTATLDPLLGTARYRASVLVDCDTSTSEQTEESVDPTRTALLNSQKTEETAGSGASSGTPGTASNLPRPTSRPGSSGSTTTRKTENLAYQTSRLVRTSKTPQGSIKRVSAAVLLDQSARWEGSGPNAQRVLSPPTPEMLKSVRDVVATVVGFSQERGDQITVETQPFEATLNEPPPAEPAKPAAPAKPTPPKTGWVWNGMSLAVSVAAALLLAAAVQFFSKRKKKKVGAVETSKALPAAPGGEAGVQDAVEEFEARVAAKALEQERAEMAALASIKLPAATSKKADVLVKQIREGAKKDVTASVRVMQTWIHENQ
jgi:flagellar M-ring protein FliF